MGKRPWGVSHVLGTKLGEKSNGERAGNPIPVLQIIVLSLSVVKYLKIPGYNSPEKIYILLYLFLWQHCLKRIYPKCRRI